MFTLLVFLHQRLAIALILYAAVLGLWGLAQSWRRRQVSPGFRSSFLLMIALTAVQGLLGATSLVSGGRPHDLLHIVYGIFAVIFLPGVYFYAAGRGPETGTDRGRMREATYLTAACWIVAIAFGRGIMTG
ncbi:MAG TPA: hypothetical protein VNI34_05555 [Candidatus Nitrosotalea sp.]|nr:hypothetical protein [Candidatus Nitrosotalea sp.]